MIKAKFYVSNLVPGEGTSASKVDLNAVCRGVENALWSQATPAGSITMYVKNDPAFKAFEQGAEYEVTFRKVAKPAPGDGHEVKPVSNMHGWLVCETCGITLCLTPQNAAQAGVDQTYAPDSDHHKQVLAQHDKIYGAKESELQS